MYRLVRAAMAAPVLCLLAAGCATTGGSPGEAGAASPRASGSAKPAYRQSDFLGRGGEAIDALLGAPALVRREGEGEFRRYALAQCTLIVILYPDEKGRRTARHLDAAARVAGESKPDLDRCLARGA